jgi:NAD(P)-dependent dehydrogenase (short-subunit alcohol dehydrogenase family)
VVDRDESAYEVAAEIAASGREAVGLVADVSSSADSQMVVDTAVDRFGGVDIVVNNAGILRDGLLHKMTDENWDDVLRVNLRGHFTITRAALPILRQRRWGRIINTASEAGLGASGSANYAASKEGVIGLTRSLAIEVRKFGITANAIRPRASTPLAASVAAEMRVLTDRIEAGEFDPGPPTFDVRARRNLTDQPDLMRPDVVAAFVVLLSSDEGGSITGGDFIIGGDELAVLPSALVPTRRMRCDGGWDLKSLRSVLPQLVEAHGGEAPTKVVDQLPMANSGSRTPER